MKVVIDTNVFISGIFFGGPPYEILKAWRDDKFLACALGRGDAGLAINLARDVNPGEFNPGDIRLGSLAALHGVYLRRLLWEKTPDDVSSWIDALSP